MTNLSMLSDSGHDELRKKKNMVGIAAIAILLVLTMLSFAGVISVTVWIVADIVVAVVANLILILMGRQRKW
jgi:hypothetical protein